MNNKKKSSNQSLNRFIRLRTALDTIDIRAHKSLDKFITQKINTITFNITKYLMRKKNENKITIIIKENIYRCHVSICLDLV